jgi:hypothetical protein
MDIQKKKIIYYESEHESEHEVIDVGEITQIYDDNCPANLDSYLLYESIDCIMMYEYESEYDDFVNTENKNELSESIIKALVETIHIFFECGATIHVEIFKKDVDNKPNFDKEEIIKRMGWNEPDAFNSYVDEFVFDIDEFGYVLYEWEIYGHVYYIFMSGIPA